MSVQYTIDLAKGSGGMSYSVVAYPSGNGDSVGACPQIPSVEKGLFHQRLRSVLGLTPQFVEGMVERLDASPNGKTEFAVSATREQLRQLGFMGVSG